MSSPDMISLLVQDHREVKDLFDRIETAPQDERRGLADTATTALVQHSVAEEIHLYPTAREALPDGDAIAEREIAEHGQVETLLNGWEGTEPGEADFTRIFHEVRDAVLSHVEEEEGELFPRLQEACSAQQLQELGGKIEGTKAKAPTRPHPSAPDSRGALKTAAPGARLVDRIRDMLTGRTSS